MRKKIKNVASSSVALGGVLVMACPLAGQLDPVAPRLASHNFCDAHLHPYLLGWEKGNRREFRSGVLHASGGAQDNVVDFTFDKVASRTYKIDMANLGVGEYGFLAPGTTASPNAASQGKVYTFRIVE